MRNISRIKLMEKTRRKRLNWQRRKESRGMKLSKARILMRLSAIIQEASSSIPRCSSLMATEPWLT